MRFWDEEVKTIYIFRGQALKEARAKLAFSQEKMGEKLNISSMYVHELENNKKKPSRETGLRIENKLSELLRDKK